MYKWWVCPVQGRQLFDVHKEDIFGNYRICDTYRGGGGYDQLPKIIKRREINKNKQNNDTEKQFVVQLYGCHLRCPYCYVTKDGIFGKYVEVDTNEMLFWFSKAMLERRTGVFHLMGGSPALYLDKWPLILEKFPKKAIFHSDLLLSERVYKIEELVNVKADNAIYAVNIKGTTDINYKMNTGQDPNWVMMWGNLDRILRSGINFYITFTNPDNHLIKTKRFIKEYFGPEVLEDSFVINLVEYDAIKGKGAW